MFLSWSVVALAGPSALITEGKPELLEAQRLISSDDGNVLVANTGAAVIPLVGPGSRIEIESGGIAAVDVSGEGWLLLGHGGTITMHDPGGRELLRLGGFEGLVDLALSPDAALFAVATSEAVSVHRAADGRQLWSRPGPAWSVEFHPDGRKLIAGIETGNLLLDVSRGKVRGGFDTQPAVWFRWTSGLLWTREAGGTVRAWDPVTLEPVEELAGSQGSQSVAVHPRDRWILIDGCVSGTRLCVGDDIVDAAFVEDETLWVATADRLQRWLPTEPGVLQADASGAGVSALVAAGQGDWIQATTDGALARLAADGTERFSVSIPGCASPCTPLAVGGYAGGAWAVGPGGEVMEWDAAGRPLMRKPATAKALGAGRLADGAWVVLLEDGRVRIGPRFGKGPSTFSVAEPRGLVVGGEGFVVFGDEVFPFAADGTPRPKPRLGPDRVPRAVAVDAIGLAFVVLDDVGSLHRYSADGRPVFRAPLQLPPELDAIAWSLDGAHLFVGGSPLQAFDASDGARALQLALSPPGEASLLAPSPDGLLGVVQGGPSGQQVLLVDPAR